MGSGSGGVDVEKGSLPIDYEKFTTPGPIKPLDVISKILNDFPHDSNNPPYRCKNHRDNPTLEELQAPTYREHFEELKNKRGKPLRVYQRDLSDYDFEEYEFENLSYEEWEALPNRPTEKINKLLDEIRKGNAAEARTGIYHIKHFSTWGPEMVEQIEIPQLKVNEELLNGS